MSSVQGLASGIQWQDLVTQIMAAETSRRLDPVTALAATKRQQVTAWSAYRDKVNALSTAAKKLKDGTAFDTMKVSGGTSPSTNRTLFEATASNASAAGNYQVEVLGVAQAEKLGSALFASATTAANIAGDFVINGKAVTLIATDSLTAVRDKINAANTGTTASGVAATLVSASGGAQRLVLTSATTGAAGIQFVDGANRALRALGLVDGTTANVPTASGGSATQRFADSATPLGTLLGITTPAPTTFLVGGQTINVDFATDTLTTLANKLTGAGVQASVGTETVGTRTFSHLDVAAQVAADPSDAVASSRALELLGFTRGGRAADAQVINTQGVLKDATNAVADSATLVTDLRTPGATGLTAGGTVQIRGTRGDGSAVSLDFTVGANSTLGDLVAFMNNGASANGFNTGSRKAVASIVNGQVVVTDTQGGASELALSLTSATSGALDFGATSVQVTGLQREIVDGTDARVRIDGTVITSNNNSLRDALPGVNIDLVRAEQGTVIDLSIKKDIDGIAAGVKAFATAFNDTLTFVRSQIAPGGVLAANSSIRASMSAFTNTMLTQVAGLTGTSYTQAAIAGLTLSKTGTLQVDDAVIKAALSTNFDEVRRMFGEKGTPSDGEVTFLLASSKSQPGTYAVDITTIPTSASVTGTALAGGLYVDDATADTLHLVDSMSGKSVDIALANGDTTNAIVAKLNAGFTAGGLRVAASNVGGALKLDSLDVGTGATFTVSYLGGGTDASAQLGIGAAVYAGTDIKGSIGGVVATGSGRTLTGALNSPTEGLSLNYTGNLVRNAGTLNYVLGVGGMMSRAVDLVTHAGDGIVDLQSDSLSTAALTLDRRADDIQKRLDMRREAMTKQFAAMEAALSKLQGQQSWLTSQINAMSSQNR